jgi:hypothetical protein
MKNATTTPPSPSPTKMNTPNPELEKLDADLNKLHSVLTNLLMRAPGTMGNTDFERIEDAEESLNNFRNEVVHMRVPPPQSSLDDICAEVAAAIRRHTTDEQFAAAFSRLPPAAKERIVKTYLPRATRQTVKFIRRRP